MNPTIRNILAVIAGLFAGAILNGAIIGISDKIIAPPLGADVKTMEGLKASLHLFEPKHFIMPFLAHALGTLAGAFLAALIGVSVKMRLAIIVGFFFLAGGIINVIMLPAPAWFCALDLIGAYLPMAWIGGRLAVKRN